MQNMHVIAKMISYICSSYNCKYYFRLLVIVVVHVIDKAKTIFAYFYTMQHFLDKKIANILVKMTKW